jgi:hypothetical protein
VLSKFVSHCGGDGDNNDVAIMFSIIGLNFNFLLVPQPGDFVLYFVFLFSFLFLSASNLHSFFLFPPFLFPPPPTHRVRHQPRSRFRSAPLHGDGVRPGGVGARQLLLVDPDRRPANWRSHWRVGLPPLH